MKLDDVTQNYNRAARHYDRLADIVFGTLLGLEEYREWSVDQLGDVEGKTVLDVGCGTGRNLPLLVPRVGPRGRVVALDYSSGMLEQARRLVDEHGWSNVQLLQGDAAKLAGVPDPLDATISVWCLGIVHDLDAALRRMVEVLKAGGRLVIMDFAGARPERGPLRWLYPAYSALLRRTGIDSAEDLDDARLRARWRRGRELLDTLLENTRERRYLADTGFILSGTKRG